MGSAIGARRVSARSRASKPSKFMEVRQSNSPGCPDGVNDPETEHVTKSERTPARPWTCLGPPPRSPSESDDEGHRGSDDAVHAAVSLLGNGEDGSAVGEDLEAERRSEHVAIAEGEAPEDVVRDRA